ncbi:MAG: type II toxin-antitoxin system PemK/MazF family toxin [Schaedlerella sp.]
MERTIRRGDIYYAELNPVVGSEQGGIRPVLIISNDIGNSHSPTVIIAAITGKTQTKAKLPTHTEVKDVEGLDRDSIILLEQIRTIDKRRLREYMGTLDKRFLPAMDKALAISIGLNGYSQCPMKQGRLSASLPAHECCPLHDDSVQKRISPLVIWYNHSLIH